VVSKGGSPKVGRQGNIDEKRRSVQFNALVQQNGKGNTNQLKDKEDLEDPNKRRRFCFSGVGGAGIADRALFFHSSFLFLLAK